MHLNLHKLNENYMLVKTDNENLQRSLYDYFKKPASGAEWRVRKRRKTGKGWDGSIRLMTPAGRLPMGLYGKLMDFINVGGVTFSQDFAIDKNTHLILDIKEFCKEEAILLKERMDYEPYDYQFKVLINAILHKRSTTLSATSSGKSYMIYLMSKYRRRMGAQKTLIIVPRITLITQITDDFNDFSGDEWENDVHHIYEGQSHDTDKPIVISTWQSLQNEFLEWFEQFDTLIVDEVHGAKATEMVNLINKCGHIEYRFGLTGTLDGSDTHEWQTIAYFGDVYKAILTKEMIERGIATPAEVHVVIFDHPDKETHKARLRAITDPMKRARAETEFIENCSFRNAFIASLTNAKTKKGENTLILFKSVEHGKHLHSLLSDARIIYGAIKGKERKEIKEWMKKAEGAVLLASYGTFAEGEFVPRIHNIIAAGNYRGRIKVLQSIGRGLRLHFSKKVIKIFDFADDVYDTCTSIKHLKEKLMMYTEPDIDFPYTLKKIKVKG